MTDNFKFYEDENIEVFSEGAIFRKNAAEVPEIIRNIALRYKYLSDVFALFISENEIKIEEFEVKCHKVFGFYKRHYKKMFDEILKNAEVLNDR